MEKLLQTKEYVKELMMNRFKSVFPDLDTVENFPILVKNFIYENVGYLWLWLLPNGKAVYYSFDLRKTELGLLKQYPDSVTVLPEYTGNSDYDIYDAEYWRRVYDKTKDDGVSYTLQKEQGFVVEFFYNKSAFEKGDEYQRLISIEDVESVNAIKRESCEDNQNIFKNRESQRRYENKPCRLKVEGFLFSADFDEYSSVFEKHKNEYQKNGKIKLPVKIDMSFPSKILFNQFHNYSSEGDYSDYFREFEKVLALGDHLQVLYGTEVYHFPKIRDFDELVAHQKEFFATPKSNQEIRQFCDDICQEYFRLYSAQKNVEFVIVAHDETGSPQFRIK